VRLRGGAGTRLVVVKMTTVGGDIRRTEPVEGRGREVRAVRAEIAHEGRLGAKGVETTVYKRVN